MVFHVALKCRIWTIIDQSMGHPFILGQKYQKANH